MQFVSGINDSTDGYRHEIKNHRNKERPSRYRGAAKTGLYHRSDPADHPEIDRSVVNPHRGPGGDVATHGEPHPIRGLRPPAGASGNRKGAGYSGGGAVFG